QQHQVSWCKRDAKPIGLERPLEYSNAPRLWQCQLYGQRDSRLPELLGNDIRLRQPDVQRLMTAYQPEDIAEAKEQWQDYTRTEAFTTMAGLDGDTAKIVATMEKAHETTTPTQQPELTPEQNNTMEKGWASTVDTVAAARTAMLHTKGTGGLFNQARFDGVTDDVKLQQEEAQ
ncbi:hypothetical protein AB4219_15855, partial [Vibrio atlanticus]